jgi:hypothetical protein
MYFIVVSEFHKVWFSILYGFDLTVFSDLLFPLGDPSLIDGEFLDKFDIIVVSGASLKTKVQILRWNYDHCLVLICLFYLRDSTESLSSSCFLYLFCVISAVY